MNVTLDSIQNYRTMEMANRFRQSYNENKTSDEIISGQNQEISVNTQEKEALSREEIERIRDESTMNVSEIKNFLFMLMGADLKLEESQNIAGLNLNRLV